MGQEEGPQLDIKRAEEEIRQALSPRRLKHVMGVRAVAVELAEIHGVARQKVEFAALLHDWAKETPEEEFLKLVHQGEAQVDEETLACPRLFHAELAAVWIEQRFGVVDREIVEAVRYHPTGAPGLGQVGRILFVADFCEPGRPMPHSDRIRAVARQDLHRAVREVLEEKIIHLARRGRRIHSRAIDFWNELIDRRGPSLSHSEAPSPPELR
jgi:predicted HD superfamily hydrolase involved in NAD metabolism